MNQELLKRYAYKKNASILTEHIEDIKILLEHHATHDSIVEYLKEEKDVTTSRSNLSKFIKRHIKKEPYKPLVKNEEDKIKKEDDTPKPQKKSLYLLD